MFVPLQTLSPIPPSGVGLTYDFAPLFLGLVVGVCLGVLAVAFMIGLYDCGWFGHPRKPSTEQSASTPDLPDAA